MLVGKRLNISRANPFTKEAFLWAACDVGEPRLAFRIMEREMLDPNEGQRTGPIEKSLVYKIATHGYSPSSYEIGILDMAGYHNVHGRQGKRERESNCLEGHQPPDKKATERLAKILLMGVEWDDFKGHFAAIYNYRSAQKKWLRTDNMKAHIPTLGVVRDGFKRGHTKRYNCKVCGEVVGFIEGQEGHSEKGGSSGNVLFFKGECSCCPPKPGELPVLESRRGIAVPIKEELHACFEKGAAPSAAFDAALKMQGGGEITYAQVQHLKREWSRKKREGQPPAPLSPTAVSIHPASTNRHTIRNEPSCGEVVSYFAELGRCAVNDKDVAALLRKTAVGEHWRGKWFSLDNPWKVTTNKTCLCSYFRRCRLRVMPCTFSTTRVTWT